MKKATLILAGVLLISSCKNTTNEVEAKTENEENNPAVVQQEELKGEDGWISRGEEITPTGAIAAHKLDERMVGVDSLEIKLEGTINASCKKKGCWMKMDIGGGDELRISFKDYGFFVPKDLNGETAIIEGVAKMETISIDDLKHLAEDAGKSEEEIAAITEPKTELVYEATGVLINYQKG
mgnify:CR=1 FL=1